MPAPITGGSVIAGNMSFSSSDSSLVIDGGPALGQVDFKLATPGLAAGLPLVLVSAPLNMLALSSNVPMLGRSGQPFTAPGKIFIPFNGRFVSSDLNGLVTTSPTAQYNAGNDATKTNVYIAITDMGMSSWNSANATPAAPGGQISAPLPNGAALCKMDTPILVDVTRVATLSTATVLTVRLLVAGYLV